MKPAPSWIERPISAEHDRKRFDCGDADLNDYLQRYARQNHTSGGAKCFIASPKDAPEHVLGFHTLSPASLSYAKVPAVARRGLGHYDVPVFRLRRLAVDLSVQGQGLGGRLLLAAGERAVLVAQEVGGAALLIDAKNERVAEWYRGHGAVPLLDAERSLVLPLATVEAAIRAAARNPR